MNIYPSRPSVAIGNLTAKPHTTGELKH